MTEDLTPQERERYARHLSMPEVGPAGQARLKAGKVLIAGAGGLGSPVGLYLAAAGVGTIGLADFDVVDASNLQRQVLYSHADLGERKTTAARRRIVGLSPGARVVCHEERLGSENALEVLGGYDVVVDGTDNFPARYLLNDACALLGKPDVHGSVFRFEGQASVFWAGRGPCYRCLYPEPPPPGSAPSCAEAGVLGVLPGMIGTVMAVETLKLLLGIGTPLLGEILVLDALGMDWRKLRLAKDPACPLCGPRRTIRGLVDYERPCAADAEISAERLKARLDAGERLALLDVREPGEHALASLPGAKLLPLGELAGRLAELDRGAELVVYCKLGGRSAKAVALLRERGFPRAVSLAGGIDAWSRRIDPSVPTY